MTPQPHWIAVVGSPGIGKSTLCRALADSLARDGAAVDSFAEEEILTRPAFRAVAEEFAGGAGSVRPAVLVDAARRHAAQTRADRADVTVTDALIPYIPSLQAWGHDEPAITRIAREIAAAVAPTPVGVLVLRGDPAAALRRAAAREGPGWAESYIAKLRNAPGTGHVVDLHSAAEHLREEAELTLRVLAATGWPTAVLDADARGAAELAEEARAAVDRWRGAHNAPVSPPR